MNIKVDGDKVILDYRYKNQRYRPVLGYNLTADEAQEAALRVINAIHAHVGGSGPKTGTFAEFIPTYLNYIAAQKKDADGRNAGALRNHLIPHFGAMRLHDITLNDGLAYLKKRADAAPGTVERECAVLMAVLNLAIDTEQLDKNRLKRLPIPKYEERKRVLQAWELPKLKTAANPDFWRLIMAALQMGLREEKLIESAVERMEPRKDGYWFRPIPGNQIKGVPEEIPLNSLALDALHGSTRRIAGRFFDRWSSGHGINELMTRTCARAGIVDLKFHDLRHTFGSWLTSLGAHYVVVEKMLGHALPGTGDLYIHQEAWAPLMREAVTKLDAHTRNLLDGKEIVAVMDSHGHLPNTNDLPTPRKITG
jgi:integrase